MICQKKQEAIGKSDTNTLNSVKTMHGKDGDTGAFSSTKRGTQSDTRRIPDKKFKFMM